MALEKGISGEEGEEMTGRKLFGQRTTEFSRNGVVYGGRRLCVTVYSEMTAEIRCDINI